MRRAAPVALVVLAVVSLAACFGKSDPLATGKRRAAQSSTTTTVPVEVRVEAASVAVESMRPDPPEFPGPVKDAVVATLNAWVGAGVVKPLITGQAPIGLDGVFTPVALARLSVGTPDRASLVEEGAGPGATGAVQPERASVALTALAGPDGSIDLVTAGIDLALLFVTPAGARVRIVRTGDMMLIPVPGGWRIDSYDVVTNRDSVPA